MACRLELHTENSNTKPELIFMDQIDEVPAEFAQVKNEQCIQIKCKESIRTGSIVLTNSVSNPKCIQYTLTHTKLLSEYATNPTPISIAYQI